MTKTRTLLGSLAACALLASMATSAFAAGDEPDAIPIEGAEGIPWQLVEQSVDGTMTAVPDGVVVTLLLEDGAGGGNGGCNNYFGEYTLEGTSLTFGPIGSTMMLCEGPASEVEAAYLANLASVATWANTGGSLVLGGADGQPILNFLPAATEPAASIEGITWLLTSQAVDGQLAALPSGDPPIVVSLLLDEGRAGGRRRLQQLLRQLHAGRLQPGLRPHRRHPDVLRGTGRRGRDGLPGQPRHGGLLGL